MLRKGDDEMSSFKKQFSNLFELPEEVMLDAPLIMMVGDKELYLENHKGIALYQNDLIKIRIKSGLLKIKGTNLELNQIKSIKLYISGEITSLEYSN